MVDTFLTPRKAGFDMHNRVALLPKPCFEQERCIDDQRLCVGRSGSKAGLPCLFHQWVNQPFEPATVVVTAKDNVGHDGAIDLP